REHASETCAAAWILQCGVYRDKFACGSAQIGSGGPDSVRCSWNLKRIGGRIYEHCGWTEGAGFHAAGPEQEGSEAFGFCGEKESGAGVLSAGLEPDLHQRTCVLRERHAQ